jgi:uncharacterized protein (DUF1778 family)
MLEIRLIYRPSLRISEERRLLITRAATSSSKDKSRIAAFSSFVIAVI